ncbi:uncharacterized protein LOC122553402 isoform X3 [Chiloscyllium plagiosum]|uniref:uncharacterized protein LOC122553402 isoform X3 n=1 Tax=Chiloscyllium plagiosum TaxID=36176 RepID=UPI001CB7CF01|nr:uncharacterized protein LOC122553402 isoform X3 [Chiloscyllium plagiosum]
MGFSVPLLREVCCGSSPTDCESTIIVSELSEAFLCSHSVNVADGLLRSSKGNTAANSHRDIQYHRHSNRMKFQQH